MIRVQYLQRMTVPAEKICEAKDIAVVCRSEDNRTSGAGFDESDTSQNERPHDPLTEFGFGDN
jgi:hypothetical protein